MGFTPPPTDVPEPVPTGVIKVTVIVSSVLPKNCTSPGVSPPNGTMVTLRGTLVPPSTPVLTVDFAATAAGVATFSTIHVGNYTANVAGTDNCGASVQTNLGQTVYALTVVL